MSYFLNKRREMFLYLATKPKPIPYLEFWSPNAFILGCYNTDTSKFIKGWEGTMEYSTDKTTWSTWDGSSYVPAAKGSDNNYRIYVRGTNNTYVNNQNGNVVWILYKTDFSGIAEDMHIEGHLGALLDYKRLTNGETLIPNKKGFMSIFYGLGIVDVDIDLLPTMSFNTYSYMFAGCKSLTSVNYRTDGITYIGGRQHKDNTNLISITIPSGVTSFGDEAFYNCENLKRVNIPSLDDWFKKGFYNTTSNPLYYAKNLYVNNKAVTNLVVPNTITSIKVRAFCNFSGLTSIAFEANSQCTSIEGWAFQGCTSLTKITIPSSVTSIEGYVFQNCNSLSTFNYSGTMAQWGSVTKGISWKENAPFTVVHCSDGDVNV